MNFREHRISGVVLLVGALMLVAHVALGLLAVIALDQWVSGAVIGAVILVFALAHIVVGKHGLPGHHRG